MARADAVVAINMIHIAPWTATEGLMAGSGRTLPPGGVFYLYGPFKEDGRHTAPSNADFDAGLRVRNPDWGVRDLGDVSDLARAQGLDLVERISMPANNLSLIFRSQEKLNAGTPRAAHHGHRTMHAAFSLDAWNQNAHVYESPPFGGAPRPHPLEGCAMSVSRALVSAASVLSPRRLPPTTH